MSSASALHDAFDNFHANIHSCAMENELDNAQVCKSQGDLEAANESANESFKLGQVSQYFQDWEVGSDSTLQNHAEALIRKKLHDLHKLHVSELEHCSLAAKEDAGQGVETLKELCEQSIKAALELQDVLDVLCRDIRKESTQGSPTKRSGKDSCAKTLYIQDFELCGSPVNLRRCSSYASNDSERVFGDTTPERKRICNPHSAEFSDFASQCGQSPIGPQAVMKTVLQPLQPTCLLDHSSPDDKLASLWRGHLTPQDSRLRSPEKRRNHSFSEDSGPMVANAQSLSPEKGKCRAPIEESPEKKKTRPLMEESPDKKKLRAFIDESPEKKKIRALVEESLLQGYSLSGSPEKQKTKSAAAACSPDKRKAIVLRAAHLDPLRYVPKALQSSSLNVAIDRDMLQLQERNRLKKSESLPQLARFGGHATGS
jgi:hypothetical protein